MRRFESRQIQDAVDHALDGGQALHLHQILTPGAPACFVRAVNRGENIAHLLDQDTNRLRQTARQLGVRVVVIEREGTTRQHIDLCGKPLARALAMCEE